MNFLTAASKAGATEQIEVIPSWSSFVILLVVVIELMVAGYFLKRKWLEKHEALPISAALAMMFLMISLYALVGSALYWSGSHADRARLLYWLFILYIPLVIQYGMNVVNALTWRLTMRVAPVGVQIPESPVVAHAQKMLMAGKVDEATALYTSLFERRSLALAEVARLLKAEGKYAEVVEIYRELVEEHASDRVTWPEAAYTLAKIHETELGQPARAIELYRRLLDEAPESRFTHLAGADLARLMVMDANFIKSVIADDDEDRFATEDPFYAQRRNFLKQRIEQREREEQRQKDNENGTGAGQDRHAGHGKRKGKRSRKSRGHKFPTDATKGDAHTASAPRHEEKVNNDESVNPAAGNEDT